MPTVELAHVIRERVIPNEAVHGVYHVAAEPISKLDLLRLIAAVYGRSTPIAPDDTLCIDRSLDGSRNPGGLLATGAAIDQKRRA